MNLPFYLENASYVYMTVLVCLLLREPHHVLSFAVGFVAVAITHLSFPCSFSDQCNMPRCIMTNLLLYHLPDLNMDYQRPPQLHIRELPGEIFCFKNRSRLQALTPILLNFQCT